MVNFLFGLYSADVEEHEVRAVIQQAIEKQ